MNEPACRVNAAEIAPALIMTDDGAVSKLLTAETTTLAPPARAVFVNATVQVLEAFGPRLVGLQANEEMSAGATKLMVALAEPPL